MKQLKPAEEWLLYVATALNKNGTLFQQKLYTVNNNPSGMSEKLVTRFVGSCKASNALPLSDSFRRVRFHV